MSGGKGPDHHIEGRHFWALIALGASTLAGLLWLASDSPPGL